MCVNTVNFGIIVLYVIPFVEGGTVHITTDNVDVKGIVREVVKDILSDANVGANSDIHQALTDIEVLKNKSNFLEQKVLRLERQNGDKDRIIRFLHTSMRELRESVLRSNSAEIDSTDLTNEIVDNGHNGTKRLMRKKRQIAVPTMPTVPTVRTLPTVPAVQNIAFSAYLTHTQSNMSPKQTIIFDHILLNDGQGYNSHNGIFTAPVSGTYLFTFHFDAHVHTFVRLNVDGANIVDAVANPHTTNTQDGETMSGNTVVIHVGIGQAVSVEVYDVSGETASSNKYRLSTFSGVLLYPE